jgi:hypothetical protein
MVNSMTNSDGRVTLLNTITNKKATQYRKTFQRVWMEFLEDVNSPLTEVAPRGKRLINETAIRILDMLISILIGMSSFGISSIRHAVTESGMCLGQALVKAIADFRTKRELCQRQLNADEKKSKNSNSSSKVNTIQKNIDEYTEVNFSYFLVIVSHVVIRVVN